MRFFRYIITSVFLLSLSFSQNTDALKTIKLQLKHNSAFEYSGFFVAKERGYYRDIGLKIEIKKYNNGIDIIDDVINSNSDYGLVSSSSIADISNGKEIVYLMAIYQSSPLILLTNKTTNIDNLSAIKNRDIMLSKDDLLDATILSMFASEGIKIDNLKIANHSCNIQDLISGKVDIISAYITNEPFTLKRASKVPIIFDSKDFGFDFYDDILIINKSYSVNNPEEISMFKQATIMGYEYAFNNI